MVEARLPQPGARHHAFHLLSLGHDQKDFNQSSTAEARVLNAMYHLVLWIWNRIQIESVFTIQDLSGMWIRIRIQNTGTDPDPDR